MRRRSSMRHYADWLYIYNQLNIDKNLRSFDFIKELSVYTNGKSSSKLYSSRSASIWSPIGEQIVF